MSADRGSGSFQRIYTPAAATVRRRLRPPPSSPRTLLDLGQRAPKDPRAVAIRISVAIAEKYQPSLPRSTLRPSGSAGAESAAPPRGLRRHHGSCGVALSRFSFVGLAHHGTAEGVGTMRPTSVGNNLARTSSVVAKNNRRNAAG